MLRNFSVKRVKKRNLLVGILLVAMGIAMPMVLHVSNFGVYETLYRALEENEGMYVIYAALKLVSLNTLRCLPHYLGAFFLGESIEIYYKDRPLTIVRLLLVCSVIPLVYFLIGVIYGIHYDFGVPAVLLIALLIMLEKANFSMVNLSKKTLMVVLLISSMQFHDVMPALSSLPFGRGEASNDIKLVSTFLGVDGFLQFATTLMFLLLFFSSCLLCKLIMDENNLKVLSNLKEQNERMVTERRIRMLEERTYRELQHLVHDLKTPLTSAQALVSVVKLGQERQGEAQTVEYLTRVESSMEHMSAMISEILYEDHRTVVTVEKLMNLMLAQISTAEYAKVLRYRCEVPEKCVEVNEIRLQRALVNVIENAYYALDKEHREISLEVSSHAQEGEEPGILFRITDNGRGIPPENLRSVWEGGFSTRDSHGLGLVFVKQVIEANNGTVRIDSVEGEGSRVTIVLPESVGVYEEHGKNLIHR